MKQYIAVIALALMLASCGGNNDKQKSRQTPEQITPSNTIPTPASGPVPALSVAPVTPGGLTVNEQNGIREVTNFYGGKCGYTTGTQGDKRFFKLEISGSGALDSNMQITELNASNIALLFYKELRAERSSYNEIRAAIQFSDGRKIVKTYSTDKLETVVSKMLVVMKIAGLLHDKKYDEIGSMLNENSGFATYDKGKLIGQIKSAEAKLGNVKQFIPYGFIFIKAENKKLVLHISGVLVRDVQNNEFSVDFDPASNKDEAFFLNYKL
jgi:hypothetical protein